jgi:hypothetical protein
MSAPRLAAPLALLVALTLTGCPTRFDPPRLGITVSALQGGMHRYVHTASHVAFRIPGEVERGERAIENGRYERVSVSTAAGGASPLYRVVILRTLDGSRVPAQEAVDEMAEGLIDGQTVDRDVCRTLGGHPARFLALADATERGDEGWFLVVSDGTVLVLMEMVGPSATEADLETLPETFFSTLELGVSG